METQRARIRLMISGRVQGVGFRFAAHDMATELGLSGWVRNLRDGENVEIVAEGKRENLLMMAAWAHRGPAYAKVDNVNQEWLEFTGEFNGFNIR